MVTFVIMTTTLLISRELRTANYMTFSMIPFQDRKLQNKNFIFRVGDIRFGYLRANAVGLAQSQKFHI